MSSSRGYAVVRGSMTSLPHFEGRVVVIGGGFAGLAVGQPAKPLWNKPLHKAAANEAKVEGKLVFGRLASNFVSI